MNSETKLLYEEAVSEVKRVYQLNDHPFLIGFSGGKDSTLTLDIVLKSLEELHKKSKRNIHKPTFIVSSDTLIENPFVIRRIDEIEKFVNDGKLKHLKVKFIRCKPVVEESFWTLIIGRGYPLPLNRFRWCTRHLKIKPMELASYEIQNKYQNIVNVLGIRKNESASRREKMNSSIIENESYLFKNFEEERNLIFAPIQKFEINHLWNYLLSEEYSFWGSDFKILFQMYQDSSKECPTSNEMRVIASKADSCGNSRWGCWICPLSNNIWIDNMYENGITDFKDVVEFRKTLMFERDVLSNRYIGKHIRKKDGTYSLGIRGLQKLKYDSNSRTYYRPEKNKSRERCDIVIRGKVATGWTLIKNYKDIENGILYDERKGANNNLVVKLEGEYFVFAPGPYTLKYRLKLFEKVIILKKAMASKKIRAGTEEAEIDIISYNEFLKIKTLLISNAAAISNAKHRMVEKRVNEIEKLWSESTQSL